MKYFPMFIELEGREVLVCGGGSHGVEKVKRLQPFGPRIRVISEKILDQMEEQERIVGQVPDNVDEILGWMADMRDWVRERIPDKEGRRKAFRSMVERAFQAGCPLGEEELRDIFS